MTEGQMMLKKMIKTQISLISLDRLSYGGLKDTLWGEIPCFEAESLDELQDIVGYAEDLEEDFNEGKKLTALQFSILVVYWQCESDSVNDLLSDTISASTELRQWKDKLHNALELLEQI